MLEKLKKYRGITILVIVVIIILVIYQISNSGNTKITTASPTPSPSNSFSTKQTVSGYKEPAYTQPATNSNGQVDESSTKIQTAISNKTRLAPQLPIYIENFQTKIGLKTTLNVYTIPEDPDYQIHIEIYGIDYSDPAILQDKNKNAQAFIESFIKIKSLLSADGIDIRNVYFKFGANPYIQSAADGLIQKYNLL